MNEEKQRKRVSLLTFIVIFLIVVILLLIFSLLFLVFFLLYRTEYSTSNGMTHEYQIYQFNTQTKQGSEGLVEIFKEIKPNEYVSYRHGNNDYTLISPIGAREYRCSGTCYCQPSTNRRSSTVLNRGLFSLVAALTTLLALSKAKDQFQQECEELHRDDSFCEMENIISNVDSCEPVKEKKDIPRDWRMGPEDPNQGPKEGRYFCKGHCVTRKFSNSDLKEAANGFNCQNYKMGGTVSIDITKLTRCDLRDSMDSLIQAKYRKEILGPHCKRMSTKKDVLSEKNGKEIALCASSDNGFNPTVTCKAQGASYFVNEIQESVSGGIGCL